MNATLRKRRMTRETFLNWAERQDIRHEFDGVKPLAMVGGTQRHNAIAFGVHRALFGRLRGSPCTPLGMDAGIATIGDAVRYPDALVTCSPGPGDNKLIPDVVVVFEVSSPSSGVTDRTTKLQEYAAVSTIRHYVILEQEAVAATLFDRSAPAGHWTATPLAAGTILRLEAIGIEIPLDEFYENVQWPERTDDTRAEADGLTERPGPPSEAR